MVDPSSGAVSATAEANLPSSEPPFLPNCPLAPSATTCLRRRGAFSREALPDEARNNASSRTGQVALRVVAASLGPNRRAKVDLLENSSTPPSPGSSQAR